MTGKAEQPSYRADFETLRIEEGIRSFALEYAPPLARAFMEIDATDRAYGLPIRPWVLGETCDHIYPTCPAVIRTGRLDANDGKWWLGTYRTIDDPQNVLYLSPEWDNPCGDICGWCFRVWRGRVSREQAAA